MSTWIRPEEYKQIKEALDDWSVKAVAVNYGRAIGTIYQIKNTKNHEEYCRKYNKRQWFSLYRGNNPALIKQVMGFDYDDSGIVGEVKKDIPKIEELDYPAIMDDGALMLIDKLNEIVIAVNQLRIYDDLEPGGSGANPNITFPEHPNFDTWEDLIDYRLAKLERQVKAIEYLVRKK